MTRPGTDFTPAAVAHLVSLTFLLAGFATEAARLRITTFDKNGLIQCTNAPVPGVCTIETAEAPDSNWSPLRNAFATNSAGALTVPVGGGNRFYRLRAVNVAATAQGFTNLVQCYGILETIAGNGAGQTDGVSYWQSWFEGWPGAWASLSRPHFAMADRDGNVFIADKNSHSILRVAPDGNIYTHVGSHVGGFNGEGPAEATNLQLN